MRFTRYHESNDAANSTPVTDVGNGRYALLVSRARTPWCHHNVPFWLMQRIRSAQSSFLQQNNKETYPVTETTSTGF